MPAIGKISSRAGAWAVLFHWICVAAWAKLPESLQTVPRHAPEEAIAKALLHSKQAVLAQPEDSLPSSPEKSLFRMEVSWQNAWPKKGPRLHRGHASLLMVLSARKSFDLYLVTSSSRVPASDLDEVLVKVAPAQHPTSWVEAEVVFSNPGEDITILKVKGARAFWTKSVSPLNLWNSFPAPQGYSVPGFELSDLYRKKMSPSLDSADREMSLELYGLRYGESKPIAAHEFFPEKFPKLRLIRSGYHPPFLKWAYESLFPVVPELEGAPMHLKPLNHFLGILSHYQPYTQQAVFIPADFVRASFCYALDRDRAGDFNWTTRDLQSKLNGEGCKLMTASQTHPLRYLWSARGNQDFRSLRMRLQARWVLSASNEPRLSLLASNPSDPAQGILALQSSYHDHETQSVMISGWESPPKQVTGKLKGDETMIWKPLSALDEYPISNLRDLVSAIQNIDSKFHRAPVDLPRVLASVHFGPRHALWRSPWERFAQAAKELDFPEPVRPYVLQRTARSVLEFIEPRDHLFPDFSCAHLKGCDFQLNGPAETAEGSVRMSFNRIQSDSEGNAREVEEVWVFTPGVSSEGEDTVLLSIDGAQIKTIRSGNLLHVFTQGNRSIALRVVDQGLAIVDSAWSPQEEEVASRTAILTSSKPASIDH